MTSADGKRVYGRATATVRAGHPMTLRPRVTSLPGRVRVTFKPRMNGEKDLIGYNPGLIVALAR